MFPTERPRRLRRTPALRRLVAETTLAPDDIIAPLFVAEGADIIMVKPAMTYLDIVSDLRRELEVPLCAYHVSGEYAMVKAAAQRDWIDGVAVALEQMTAVRRAGADFVLTYFAGELAEELGR